MTRLVVSADAATDIHDVLDYLEKEAGASVAKEYGLKFRICIELLVAFPRLGPRRPALGADARIRVVPPYVLIYDFMGADDTVTLLRVVHGKRNITRRMIRSG